MKLGYLNMADIEKIHEIMKSQGIDEDRGFGTGKNTDHKTSIKEGGEHLKQSEVGNTIKVPNELKL